MVGLNQFGFIVSFSLLNSALKYIAFLTVVYILFFMCSVGQDSHFLLIDQRHF